MSCCSIFKKFWEILKTNAEYRSKVQSVLISREAKNIKFTVLGIKIDETVFPAIANDINNGTRFVTFTPSFEAGVAAVYNTDSNIMEVGKDPTNSRVWKGLVIHEAVHAWIDKKKLTPLVVDNEAVAYIAQAIYYRRVGLSRTRTPNPIYIAARDIGNVILKGQTPTAASVQKLKTLILADPAYSGISATTSDTANDG